MAIRDLRVDGQPENKTGIERLRVGVLGMGFMGGTHTQAWQRVKATFNLPIDIEMKALFDMSESSLALNGARYEFERTTQDWREVCEADDIDVVSICTPNFAHIEAAELALSTGKHVWCEKPMATSITDAEAMVALAEAGKARGLKTILGYNYMKSPTLLAIKKLIEDGVIGDIVHFNGVYTEDFMCDMDMPHSWRLTKAGGGKGALGDMGSHQVSMAIWLCGPIREVASRLQTVHHQRPDMNTGEMKQVETDDQFSAIGTFDNGALFTLHTSWLGQGHKMQLGFEVAGTKGAIRFDQERMGEFQLFEQKDNSDMASNGFKTVLIGPYHPPFGNFCPAPGHHVGFNEMKIIEAGEFCRAILEGNEAYPNFDDGLVFEKALQAIQDASEARAWVTL
ncbi:MAG: Gfo/Idh/MocA family oxidoreductase [Alphaproteobacteria bacterium]|nr:Gfo/Idh/MocA family oxidoreductase [Alphaproteobacteria bacterium]